MHVSEIQFTEAKPVDGYGPGFFRVGGVAYDGALLCAGTEVSGWGGYDDLAPLTALAGRIDVLLLGTGAQIAHPPTALREALEAAGIGADVMDSPAACRTYNVLLSEGRRVALVVLPV